MTCGLIDLNAVNTEDESALLYGPSSLSRVSKKRPELVKASPPAVSMDLWHACAGPLSSLPKKGSAAVYFPQGHLEHHRKLPAVTCDLPSHVFCRVINVELQADANNDEVYALVYLVRDQQIEQKWGDGIVEAEAEDEDAEDAVKHLTSHMFCKTLTASDTSTHGGFSVPRRAAEDCFPPLDYKQQRPSQELVAKDLHGVEWKFRHIYRGQPRRHLLTSGWSAFINNKKLVSGDAVLFLRGNDGELRLGVRRSTQVKSGAPLAPGIRQFNSSTFSEVVNAISLRSSFSILYNYRARSSDIIVPYHKFSKSVVQSFSFGTRFKIRCETEDSSNRSHGSGLVINVSDADPIRWPGSKWKCLVVKWDDSEGNNHNRVSPWEVEPSGSVSGPNGYVLPGTKRSRISFPETKRDFPVPRGLFLIAHFEDPLRFQKVFQGQEVQRLRTPFGVLEASTRPPSDTRCFPGLVFSRIHADSASPLASTAVVNDIIQCQKVSQSRETLSNLPYGRILEANQDPGDRYTTTQNQVQAPSLGIYWSNYHLSPTLLPSPSPSSVLTSQQSNSAPPRFMPLFLGNQKKFGTSHISLFPQCSTRNFASSESTCHLANDTRFPRFPFQSPQLFDDDKLTSVCTKSCRLFGFSLSEGNLAASRGDNPTSTAYGHENKLVPSANAQVVD
ncbi:auxin response factor 3 [Dorcoceras hygrometricum]|uniref:Auxin response factor n=1 Tax=Dorcoceras hygrometricum TaxID=472368 RepID=A0A2Z7D6T9_9LAMI|nr:auxin response factor 3 [Dorcoceras hygrometricum]